MIADYGRSSKEQRAAANLEKTPNRIDAIFQSIRLVQKTLDAQTADSEELAEKEKQALADRKLLDSIRFVAWIIVGLLAAILWFRR
jgi:Ni,Fe-hydrogenase III large subunit